MADETVKQTDHVKEFYRTGKLPRPTAGNAQEIAEIVYALFKHCKDKYQVWWKAGDEDRRYYRGENSTKKPTYKSNVFDPEIAVVVDTMRPRVIDSIAQADILPVDGEQAEAAMALSQRVEFAERLSRMRKQKKTIVNDVLIEGGTIIKLFSDVTAHRLKPRRVMREPEADSFDTANYIIDHKLTTVADTVIEFGKKAKKLKATFREFEADEGAPTGPPSVGSSSIMTTSFAPVGETSPINRYASTQYAEDFTAAERVLRIEMWVRDKTTVKVPAEAFQNERSGAEIATEFIDVPVYPHGRVINIGVGVNEDGTDKDGKSNVMLLMDRENQFKRLYEQTGRFPFVEILAYPTDDVWSQSVIRPLIPLQNALNDAWNQTLDNVTVVNNPKQVIHGQAGIKKGQLKNKPNEEIILPEGSDLPVNQALIWSQIPPVVQHMILVIREIKDAMRNASGVRDVSRGETPGSVTAASAIHLLQVRAENRTLLRAEDISDGMEQVKEGLAYTAQDFDEGMMRIPDDSRDSEKQFTEYDSDKSRQITIRVVGVRRKGTAEVVEILQAVAQIETTTGLGELVLMYDEDPRMHQLYIQLKETRQKAAEEQEKANANAQLAEKLAIEGVRARGTVDAAKVAAEATKEAAANRKSNEKG